jgi:formylglycine-generating enzyme required for sulfatase activity
MTTCALALGLKGDCGKGTVSCDNGMWSACSVSPQASDTCAPGDDANCDGIPNEGCPYCGDGIKNNGEACDGTDLGGATCASATGDANASGSLSCTPGCKFDLSSCLYCGNGVKEGTEQCDGMAFGGATCATLDSTSSSGALACTTTCTIDTSLCSASTSPSCAALPRSCGAAGDSDCCASALVTGGTFNLGRKMGDPDYAPAGLMEDPTSPHETPSAAAKVSTFRLDTYEVTVGRFREFVAAYDAWRGAGNPAPGSGKHAHLAAGGLNGGTETGWDASWTSELPAASAMWGDTNHLVCNQSLGPWQTWTPSPAGNETRPINCVSWYEAYAFCIWDGGFLPSEAEREYAAAGGSEERVFPWSVPSDSVDITCSYANYASTAPKSCEPVTTTANVGSRSPIGDGRYGHADLAGNLDDWTLDQPDDYPATCDDCADLVDGIYRVFRGGNMNGPALYERAVNRGYDGAADHSYGVGIRCARAP